MLRPCALRAPPLPPRHHRLRPHLWSRGTQQVALANLIDAERRATGQRTQACEAAGSMQTARLLALIAASEAGHVEFLRRASS